MKIDSFIYSISLALSLILLANCQNASGESEGAEVLDAVSDSLAAASRLSAHDSVPEPKKEVLSFSSPEEAIRYMQSSPDSKRYMAGILPQMARDELTYCTRLLNNEHPRFIIVDKERMKVILYDRYGVEEHSYGMACAKNYGTKHKRADSRTPEGFFDVEGVYDSTDWLFTDDNGVQSDKKGQFGPRFIRLRTPVSSQIGIHGTCAPWSIGGRSSHGCIRIKNENILQLVELVEKGMPVIVSPGRKDMIVNAKEGYDIPSVSTVAGRARVALAETSAPEADSTDIRDEDPGPLFRHISSEPEKSPEDTLQGEEKKQEKTHQKAPEEEPEIVPGVLGE